MKKLIINADDFGYSKNVNTAIKLGYDKGLITSTSLLVNMPDFDNAVYEILPQIPNIDLGFHFNIIEGTSLSKNKLLTDLNGNFKNNFLSILHNSQNKTFLNAIEEEFRLQIEKMLNVCPISHIDSHVHIHAIPKIFELTEKLAKEYNIKYVRTQKEIFYLVSGKILNAKFPVNIIKNVLLNSFTSLNSKRNIKSNDYFIGVLYTGYMDEKAIIEGLKAIKKENSVTELIFHPAFYTGEQEIININRHYEFSIIESPTLKNNINNLNFELTNYSKL